jgi:lysophospholipase
MLTLRDLVDMSPYVGTDTPSKAEFFFDVYFPKFLATLRLFPGIAGATISAFFIPPIRGVVLETFGAGNAPQRADLMLALKQACDRGVVVVAISQCAKGSVSDAYETGRTLLQAGVVPGGDMTPEVHRLS